MLHSRYGQYYEELEIVKWYIEVFEGGNDTKNILQDFVEAQAEIKRLKKEANKTKTTLEKRLDKLNKLFKETKT